MLTDALTLADGAKDRENARQWLPGDVITIYSLLNSLTFRQYFCNIWPSSSFKTDTHTDKHNSRDTDFTKKSRFTAAAFKKHFRY